ncbi:hypothetical protein JW933_02755 [candidate division FCPU426 bacterium]|nr:hypothetical protein [candidate division FCPU426 bacterium]
MRKYLNTLGDERTPRSIEEYLGAFTESFKMILNQNPIERMGQSVLLAAKTALRLKAANPKLREHEIAGRLQAIARNIRLTTILNDLTPEEKGIIKLRHRQDKHLPPDAVSPSASIRRGRRRPKRSAAKKDAVRKRA